MAKISASGAISNNFAQGASSLTVVSPVVGGMRVLTAGVNSTPVANSVSGGGVTAWQQAVANTANGQSITLWWGQIDNVASAPTTLTIGYTGSVGSVFVDLLSQMLVTDRRLPRWYLDTAAASNSASSTTIAFPSLTPQSGSELYFSASFVQNFGSQGSTSGFVNGASAGGGNPYAYKVDLTAAGSPTASQSPAGWYDAVAALWGVVDLGDPFPPVRQALWRSNNF